MFCGDLNVDWAPKDFHIFQLAVAFLSLGMAGSEDCIYLVQSDPVPGAAREVGCNFELGCGVSNAVPLILHHECDQGNIHLVRKLHRTFST